MTHSAPARAAARRIPWILVAGLFVVIAANAAALGCPFDVVATPQRGAPGAADGVVPDGTSVFDDQLPGVARLDPALLGALRQAAKDAANAGVELGVDSGWRSPEYQERLLLDAVSTYGSEAAAARWVAMPTTSAHVSGDAVDIGPQAAAAWLSRHGASYGLCQIYANEPWHYELRAAALDKGCPPMYADPTRDPRMQVSSTLGPQLVPPRLPRSGRTHD